MQTQKQNAKRSRDVVCSGEFDVYMDSNFPATGGYIHQVDTLFLSQINKWRVAPSNELCEEK